MTNAVRIRCSNCGADIMDGEGRPIEPCQECGSTAKTREVDLQIKSEGVVFTKARGFRAGLSRANGWFRKIDFGFRRQASGEIAEVYRELDRDANRYIEKVTLPESGFVIHNTDEQLSAHKGHGSAKKRGEGENEN